MLSLCKIIVNGNNSNTHQSKFHNITFILWNLTWQLKKLSADRYYNIDKPSKPYISESQTQKSICHMISCI